MNYGDAIVGAARLVWRHQHLWVLGIIMAIFGGGGGGRGGGSFDIPTSSGRGGDTVLPEPFQSWVEGDPGAFLGLLIAGLVVLGILVLIWLIAGIILRPIARGGLAYSVDRLENGEPSGFRTAWGGGWRRKGSLIGISLLLELLPGLIVVGLIAAIVLVVAVPLIAAGGALDPDMMTGAVVAGIGSAVVAVCCIVVIAIFVGIVLSVLTNLASVASAVEGLGTRPAIGQAWRLMRERTGPIVLIWLIGGAIDLLVGTIVALPLIFVAFGIVFGLMSGNAPAVLWLIAGFALVVAAVLALLVQGALQAYGTALWTLTFRSLTTPTPSQDAV